MEAQFGDELREVLQLEEGEGCHFVGDSEGFAPILYNLSASIEFMYKNFETHPVPNNQRQGAFQ